MFGHKNLVVILADFLNASIAFSSYYHNHYTRPKRNLRNECGIINGTGGP